MTGHEIIHSSGNFLVIKANLAYVNCKYFSRNYSDLNNEMSVTTRIALFGDSYIEHLGRLCRKDSKVVIYLFIYLFKGCGLHFYKVHSYICKYANATLMIKWFHSYHN